MLILHFHDLDAQSAAALASKISSAICSKFDPQQSRPFARPIHEITLVDLNNQPPGTIPDGQQLGGYTHIQLAEHFAKIIADPHKNSLTDLYLINHLAGAGNSTFAKRLVDAMRSKGFLNISVHAFRTPDINHPIHIEIRPDSELRVHLCLEEFSKTVSTDLDYYTAISKLYKQRQQDGERLNDKDSEMLSLATQKIEEITERLVKHRDYKKILLLSTNHIQTEPPEIRATVSRLYSQAHRKSMDMEYEPNLTWVNEMNHPCHTFMAQKPEPTLHIHSALAIAFLREYKEAYREEHRKGTKKFKTPEELLKYLRYIDNDITALHQNPTTSQKEMAENLPKHGNKASKSISTYETTARAGLTDELNARNVQLKITQGKAKFLETLDNIANGIKNNPLAQLSQMNGSAAAVNIINGNLDTLANGITNHALSQLNQLDGHAANLIKEKISVDALVGTATATASRLYKEKQARGQESAANIKQGAFFQGKKDKKDKQEGIGTKKGKGRSRDDSSDDYADNQSSSSSYSG